LAQVEWADNRFHNPFPNKDMQHTILQEIVILLAVSVIAVAAFRRLNLPPILAYLFVGVLVGPHGWGWIADTEGTRFIAEFGVVFLLFTLGLEFSLPQLVAMRRDVFGLGGTQVVLTMLVIGVTAWLLGTSGEAAIVIGGALALSSTAIVIKQLSEQIELNSRHGRLSVAILLFQDLAVVPLLIVVPVLAGQGETSLTMELGLALAKGVVVLAAMLAIGHWLLRPIFHEIARSHSSELFTLAVLLFALSAAWTTHLSGLSLALGAFLAGMMLGETEFRHQVEADIRPFRDVLLGLFFITVGMLLDIHALPGVIHWVLLVLVGLIVLKILLITLLCAGIGHEKGVALRTGITLAQGGEFGFALLSLAFGDGIISETDSQIVLAAIILSMALTPALIRYNGHVAKFVFASTYGSDRQKAQAEIDAANKNLKDHVLICGFGRIGQNIARFLEQENFRYTALDLDPVRVREARAAGQNVNYGDSTHREILEAAGLMRAKVLVLSFDDNRATEKILQQAKQLRPDIPVLVRTRDDSSLDNLLASGATEVVPETLEASLMLSSYVLMLLNVPVKRIVKHVQDVRTNRYKILRQFFPGREMTDITGANVSREGLHSVEITNGAFAVGKTLREMKLDACSISITGLRRGDNIVTNPGMDTRLQTLDVVVLYGTPEDLEHAEAILLRG